MINVSLINVHSNPKICLFITVTELVEPSKRTLVGVLPALAFAVGYQLTVFVAYFIRDRFTLELTFTAAIPPCLISLW